MFIEELFIKTKSWNQPKYPLTVKQIKSMGSIYCGILLSLKKGNPIIH